MSALYKVLESLSPVRDAEVLEGYQRYEALLEAALTPQQLETYAAHIQETGQIRVFEEMDPTEIAHLPAEVATVAAAILSDINISMENRRVVALLNQYGEHSLTPDFVAPVITPEV